MIIDSAWSAQAVNVVFQEAGSEKFTAEAKKAAGDARGHVTTTTNPQGDWKTTQQTHKSEKIKIKQSNFSLRCMKTSREKN